MKDNISEDTLLEYGAMSMYFYCSSKVNIPCVRCVVLFNVSL